jgi:hypothetical protein
LVKTLQEGIPTSPFAYGLKKFFATLELPAALPAGDYRVGTLTDNGPGGFTISDCSVETLMLECPEGFWLGRGGLEAPAPCFFRVPAGGGDVRLFASSPVAISDEAGNPLQDREGRTCGELALPAPAESSVWSITAPQPTFVRLLSLAPCVAYQTPSALFEPARPAVSSPLEPPSAPPEAPSDAPFAAGRFGRGLALAGRAELHIPRGEGSLNKGYAHFPGRTGTIEFFYRPNWSAFELLTPDDRRYGKPILQAGDLAITYLFGQAPYEDAPQNSFLFNCGKSFSFVKRPGRFKHFGNQARAWPRRNEWVHLAFAWDVSMTAPEALETRYRRADYGRGEDCETFWIYLNGRRLRRTEIIHAWPIYFHLGKEFPQDYNLTGVAETLRLSGAADGTLDELRISDGLRYTEDFAPPTAPFAPDAQTRALFHWDDALEGLQAGGLPVPVRLATEP